MVKVTRLNKRRNGHDLLIRLFFKSSPGLINRREENSRRSSTNHGSALFCFFANQPYSGLSLRDPGLLHNTINPSSFICCLIQPGVSTRQDFLLFSPIYFWTPLSISVSTSIHTGIQFVPILACPRDLSLVASIWSSRLLLPSIRLFPSIHPTILFSLVVHQG